MFYMLISRTVNKYYRNVNLILTHGLPNILSSCEHYSIYNKTYILT